MGAIEVEHTPLLAGLPGKSGANLVPAQAKDMAAGAILTRARQGLLQDEMKL